MNFFKKLNRQSDENEDLDTGYKDGYFKSSRRGQFDADDDEDGDDGRYHEPDFTARRETSAGAADDDEESARTAAPRRGYEEPDYVPSRREADRDDGFRASARPQPVPAVIPVPEPEEEPAEEEVVNAGTEFFIPSDPITCRESIIRKVMENHVVVISVVDLEKNEVTRLFDYIMGAVLVLDADISRVDKTTVVLVPNGVDFDYDSMEMPEADDGDDEEADGNEYEYDEDAEDDTFDEDDESYDDKAYEDDPDDEDGDDADEDENDETYDEESEPENEDERIDTENW